MLELNQPKKAHMAPNPQQRILLHINLVGVVGVEPTLFTTRDRIYSPEQNTPYLQHTQNFNRSSDLQTLEEYL